VHILFLLTLIGRQTRASIVFQAAYHRLRREQIAYALYNGARVQVIPQRFHTLATKPQFYTSSSTYTRVCINVRACAKYRLTRCTRRTHILGNHARGENWICNAIKRPRVVPPPNLPRLIQGSTRIHVRMYLYTRMQCTYIYVDR
jgi:hypothetical protein